MDTIPVARTRDMMITSFLISVPSLKFTIILYYITLDYLLSGPLQTNSLWILLTILPSCYKLNTVLFKGDRECSRNRTFGPWSVLKSSHHLQKRMNTTHSCNISEYLNHKKPWQQLRRQVSGIEWKFSPTTIQLWHLCTAHTSNGTSSHSHSRPPSMLWGNNWRPWEA